MVKELICDGNDVVDEVNDAHSLPPPKKGDIDNVQYQYSGRQTDEADDDALVDAPLPSPRRFRLSRSNLWRSC